jgi:hypothetical protein
MVVFLFYPLNAELNPICHLLALLGIRLFRHVMRIRVDHVIYVFLYYDYVFLLHVYV